MLSGRAAKAAPLTAPEAYPSRTRLDRRLRELEDDNRHLKDLPIVQLLGRLVFAGRAAASVIGPASTAATHH